ncbi:MAG TPA: glycosyltransferase family 4 protein [Acidimicrobiia bacterium]|nr:glycosyltransferase family 4 protein [Acidimicrobiia bacterium]
MKVAVVCPYDLGHPGGVQQLTIELVDRLERAGHEAWLVGPGSHPRARTVGGTWGVRANSSVAPIAIGPGVRRRVTAAIAGADVVHIHEPLMPRVSTVALGSDHAKVVTFHADAPGWAHGLYRMAERPLRHRMLACVITAVSPVAASAIPAAWGPVEIIPNAVDVGAYAGPPRIPGRVTFLGRDEPRKGLDVLLAAWPVVRAAMPDSELVVIGAERRSDAPAGVRYIGRVDDTDKRALLASASIHVSPNTGGESFGIVLAEAMAAGAAVVSSDLPAFVAVTGGSGVHVPPGDHRALATALVSLLGDTDRLRTMGEAARTRAMAFDWSVVLDRYIDAYGRARG